jgi:hypothetical protein
MIRLSMLVEIPIFRDRDAFQQDHIGLPSDQPVEPVHIHVAVDNIFRKHRCYGLLRL